MRVIFNRIIFRLYLKWVKSVSSEVPEVTTCVFMGVLYVLFEFLYYLLSLGRVFLKKNMPIYLVATICFQEMYAEM